MSEYKTNDMEEKAVNSVRMYGCFNDTTWKRVELSENGYLITTSAEFNETNYYSKFLENVDSNDMSVNGSSTPVTFSQTVPSNKKLYLVRSFMAIEDGSVEFLAANFGAITGSLGTGFQFKINNTTLETWQTNRDIGMTFFDISPQYKKNGQYLGRWTFFKDLQKVITLDAGDTINAVVNDNLSSLDFMAIKIKGLLVDV